MQLNKNAVNGTEPILRLIGDLPAGPPVAFEAAYGCGWLVRLPEDYGFDPHLDAAGWTHMCGLRGARVRRVRACEPRIWSSEMPYRTQMSAMRFSSTSTPGMTSTASG
ncbi:MAG: hypothetical protein ACRDOL_44205 [Streptosporangiaceae bacterium]